MCVRNRGIRGRTVFSVQFFYEPETPLKNRFIFKNHLKYLVSTNYKSEAKL